MKTFVLKSAITILALGTTGCFFAEGPSKMPPTPIQITYANGASKGFTITNIQFRESPFSKNVLITKNDGTTESIKKQDINKIKISSNNKEYIKTKVKSLTMFNGLKIDDEPVWIDEIKKFKKVSFYKTPLIYTSSNPLQGASEVAAFYIKPKNSQYPEWIFNEKTSRLAIGANSAFNKSLKMRIESICPKMATALDNGSFDPNQDIHMVIKYYGENCE